MRIINNAPLKNLEKSGSAETSPTTRPMQKLMEMLGSQSGNIVNVEALLQNRQGSLATLLISGVGLVDLPLKNSVDLPEGTTVKAALSYENGTIKVEVKPVSEENLATGSNRNTEKLLTQLGLPLTKANKEAANMLIQYKIEPSAEHIKQLAEGSFLASKISDTSKQMPVENLTIGENQNEINWNMPLKEIAVKIMALPLEEAVSNESLKPAEDLVQSGSKAAVKVLEKVLRTKESDLDTHDFIAEDDYEGTVDSKVSTQSEVSKVKENKLEMPLPLKSELQEVRQLLTQLDPKKVLSLIALGESLDLEQLKRLKSTFDIEGGQTHLKHKLFSTLLEDASVLKLSTDFKMALEEWKNESGNKMDVRAINSLTELLNRFEPELLESVKESIESYQKTSTMVESLPQHVVGLHIPLVLNQVESQLELYVQKRNGRQNSDSFKMLIALNTEHFEQVQILITDSSQQLELVFKLQDEIYLNSFDEPLKSLETELKSMLDKSVMVKTALRFEEPTVLSVTSFMGSDVASQIDVRV